MIIAGGALIAFAVLAGLALLADPLLDALDISAPAALLAAGLVVMVPALDLLWQTPGNRVRPAPDARAERLGAVSLRHPGSGVAGAGRRCHRMGGDGRDGHDHRRDRDRAARSSRPACSPGGARRQDAARGSVGAFMGAAMALLALDLVRDGVIAT